ncbi:MAG: hypothetical protein F6K62_25210 [Sphaerospermopsis sp. SIO1G2]|nr:hypothetical protein [Sphaerospermopsis sp. SIO1G2]
MKTITINSHVGQDGILHLDIPVNISNSDLTVTIIVQPSDNSQQENKPKGKGWPEVSSKKFAGQPFPLGLFS